MFTPLEAQRVALITDFDGTLSPIVDDPEHALALPAALDALRSLVGQVGLVAIVSGRPVEFLQTRVPIDGVALVGQYGLERIVDGEVVVDARVTPYLRGVTDAAAEAAQRWPELHIERKGDLAFTVHWRTRPSLAPSFTELARLADRHGLVAQPGRRACELRTPVPVDKGRIVHELVLGAGLDTGHGVFVGDDLGDLTAFDALDRQREHTDGEFGIVRVAVRSPEAPPELLGRADVIVDGPEGVAEFLRSLVRP